MSSVQNKCVICQTSFGIRNKKDVKLSCDHKFHYDCAKLRFDNGNRKDCPICRKRSALEDAFGGGKASDNKQSGSARHRSPEHDDGSDHGSPSEKGNSRFSASYEKNLSKDLWTCSRCTMLNSTSLDQCEICNLPRYSYLTDMTSSVASDIKRYRTSDVEPKPAKEERRSPSPQDPIPVYAIDLPTDLDDHRLAKHLRTRVEETLDSQLNDVKCYAKLGVGIVYVNDDKTKGRLVAKLKSLAWDPTGGKTIVSFVETLDLVSYIVVELSKGKTDADLPTADEVSRQWADLSHGEKPRSCEQINVQFPNIYRLVSTSLDQLISSLDHPGFRMKHHLAQIFFCADCSFFEEVPRAINQDQLEHAVLDAINQPHASSSSLYVQLNKQTHNACIIAANAARKWTAISHISINGKTIRKTDKLTCRLLIHSVPSEVTVKSILEHKVFQGKDTLFKHIGDTLILDVSDKDIFDDLMRRRVLRVSDKYKLPVDAFDASNEPDGNSIDSVPCINSQLWK